MSCLDLLRIAVAVVLVVAAPVGAVKAQDITSPPPINLPPPPAPPPPPKIEVPAIPKLDEVAPPPRVRTAPRMSRQDRAERCAIEAASRGLNGGDRTAYIGACINR